MKDRYETVIIGTTLTGLGLACRNKKNSLIIERTASPGHEYINAFAPGKNWDNEAESPDGKSLKKELKERNILSNGKAHISALAPVLCKFIKEKEINVLFWTEITQIEKKEGKFKLEILNASGLSQINADKIIDTSQVRTSSPDRSSIISKSVNALLHCENGAHQAPELKEGKIMEGRFSDEKFFSLPLDINEQWPLARKKLLNAWEKRPEEISSWLIASTASEFSYVSLKGPFEIEENWIHLPSTAYLNPVDSFDAGINFKLGEKK
jgi:hypothetical protein